MSGEVNGKAGALVMGVSRGRSPSPCWLHSFIHSLIRSLIHLGPTMHMGYSEEQTMAVLALVKITVCGGVSKPYLGSTTWSANLSA